MGKWCVVRSCKSGSRTEAKCSMFLVPKDPVMWKKWEEAIPGIVKLKPTDVVCEKHFDDSDISRGWVKRDANGQIIARATYKCPKLKGLAVPTKFGDVAVGKENSGIFHEYSKRCPISHLVPANDNCTHSSRDSLGTLPRSNISSESSSFMKPSMQVISTVFDIAHVSSPTADIGMSLVPKDVSCCKSSFTDSLACYKTSEVPSSLKSNEHITCEDSLAPDVGMVFPSMDATSCEPFVEESLPHREIFEVPSSQDISDQIPERKESTSAEFAAYVPESWSVGQTRTENRHYTYFSYSISKMGSTDPCPIVQKCVTLDGHGTLKYFVYGRRVGMPEMEVEGVLKKKEMLPDVLNKFKEMGVCSGLGNSYIHLGAPGEAYQDWMEKWRSKNCSLISKKTRCNFCTRSSRCLQQRAVRLKKQSTIKRIGRVSNPGDRRKLLAMQKKIRRERYQKNRAKDRVKHLKTCMEAQKEKIASMEHAVLDTKCAELNVPDSQRLALKEIIAAAANTDNRGRRYTEEWIMLCMLMNIRSPSYYEFLRKNNILPLPCMRTIRSYFSLINAKCGFDEQFAKLIEKHFASKTPLQRHGVLLLDEINLRKSVAVCSRNLTYLGLTDLGEDGQQASDINEQATHGLVLMFQPLADSYTQPIAVFASKNPVKADELAKIVVKAIAYMEQCGAMIHGVIADGAATNTKMWSLLGVQGTMKNTKSWFTHPVDSERKVFAFSDICHVMKNVRNRLYNKQKLRVKRTDHCVCWKYFQSLYDLDKVHPGNLRVCPKLTSRHVVLDNTSKMRVKLATQIFSNSVADGLRFYLSHGSESVNGCEQTISFCKRFNDMFDAMNRKSPNQGLTPHSKDFKFLEDSLRWLDAWESEVEKGDITADEYLTTETSRALRLSLHSTMDLCRYLIKNHHFEYLLTGKVNQDNLEKFFGTIRQCAGCNDHPNCPTFLQLYKLLSVYSVIKPPKYGNCTVSTDTRPATLISISELKEIYGSKRDGKTAEYLTKIKQKLDASLEYDDWEADDIIENNSEHDYALSPILDCIIYYVTGYLCKQVLKKYKSCAACEEAVRLRSNCAPSVSQLVQIKSRGGLIHANIHFFNLIRHIESSFAKYSSRADVFDLTLDEVLDTYHFTFPCEHHASEILSYAIVYYLRLRMRQNAYAENLKLKKRFVIKKKLSKLTNG